MEPDGVGAGHHGEADGQAVERVALGALGRGDVEHDEDEREREQRTRPAAPGTTSSELFSASAGMAGFMIMTTMRGDDAAAAWTTQ